MNVLDNVAYGLRVRGIGRKERNERAARALASVRLEQMAGRKPSQLSGGQRQRVALARATVVEPKVLLLDEPLGALDLKLREQMQVELKEIQRDLGITFIFVTHDQEEALTLSDRIAVFNDGRIEQLGTPDELYERPASRFVADFVGTSNLFDHERSVALLGRDGHHSVRPEKMTVTARRPRRGGRASTCRGTVVEAIYLGSGVRLVVDLDDGTRVTVLEQNVRGRVARRRARRPGGRLVARRRRRAPRHRGPPGDLRLRHPPPTAAAAPTCTTLHHTQKQERTMKRNPRTVRRGATVGLAIASVALLTACGTTQGGGSDSGEAATELGEMEGQVSLLAWPGYVEDGSNDPAVDWVTPFEEETGCEVTTKTFGTSDEALNLMKTGDYDVVSASGDASLRLVAAGDVAPVNTDLIPNYENIYPFLKDQAWNSVDGVPYGVPHGYGANLLMYNTEVVPDGAHLVGRRVRQVGRLRRQGDRVRLADLHRGCRRLPHGAQPRARHREPLRPRRGAARRRGRPAEAAAREHRRVLVGLPQGDPGLHDRRHRRRHELAGHPERARGRGGDRPQVVLPDEGATGWSDTWMIASEAKNPNCAYAWLDYIASPEANAAATVVLRRGAVERRGLRVPRGLRGVPRRRRGLRVADLVLVDARSRSASTDAPTCECTDYAAWTEAWQEIKG